MHDPKFYQHEIKQFNDSCSLGRREPKLYGAGLCVWIWRCNKILKEKYNYTVTIVKQSFFHQVGVKQRKHSPRENKTHLKVKSLRGYSFPSEKRKSVFWASHY